MADLVNNTAKKSYGARSASVENKHKRYNSRKRNIDF